MLCCNWLRLISTPKILAIVLDFCWEKTKEFKSSANCVHTSFPRESVIISSIQVFFDEKFPGMNTVTERHNAVFQGIVEAVGQTENAIKHRINAGDKTSDAIDETVASIFDNKFCVPLDFELLKTCLPLHQYGLGSQLTYELNFTNHFNVSKASNPDASYTISNISLEFDTVINASLASQIRMKSSILYDRILRAHIIPLNNSDTSFSVDINSQSKSLKCVLLIFTKERSATKFN